MPSKQNNFNKYILWIIGVIALIIIITTCVILFRRKNNTTSSNKLKSSFVEKLNLSKDGDFYQKYYQQTLKYLIQVYPTAEDTLKSLSPIELGKFYNSLWFYYNCASKYGPKDVVLPFYDHKKNKWILNKVKVCWNELPDCGNKFPKLPYTPQGYIYSFKHWLEENWTPWILSDSTIDPSEITGSFPGQTFTNSYNGPAPVWMYQRAIFRMVYNTKQPIYNNLGKRLPELLPGAIGEWKSEWNYPENWYLGVPDHGYIEVTCASEPGMAASPPLLWIDGWPGSGLFFNVGKSFRARNKCDGAFLLAQEMTKTDEGKAKLREFYGSDDPYEVIKNLIYPFSPHYEKDINNTKPTFANIKASQIWDSKNNKKIDCLFRLNSQFNPGELPQTPLAEEGIVGRWPNSTDFGFWNPKFQLSSAAYTQWCKSAAYPNGIPDKCIDDLRLGRVYEADRMANTTLFDEAVFFLGICLGYDTVQLMQSSNGADFWQYEILVLYDYPEEVKNKDYSAFIEKDNEGGYPDCPTYNKNDGSQEGGVKYRLDFTTKYMDNCKKYFSLRDPFDVNNNDKSKPIEFGEPWTPTHEYNITAKNHISDMFTGMPIIGQDFDQCKKDSKVINNTTFNRGNIGPFFTNM